MNARPPAIVRLTARFEGHVQGVGFRYTAIEVAARLGDITGYVTNTMQGDVELIAEGPEDHLHELLMQLQQSHLGRYIMHMDQQWSPAQGSFKGFDILFNVK